MAPARAPKEVVEGVVRELYLPQTRLLSAAEALWQLGELPIADMPGRGAARASAEEILIHDLFERYGHVLRSATELTDIRGKLAGSYGSPLPELLSEQEQYNLGFVPQDVLTGLDTPSSRYRRHGGQENVDDPQHRIREDILFLLPYVSVDRIFAADRTIEQCHQNLERNVGQRLVPPAVHVARDRLPEIMPPVYNVGGMGSLGELINEVLNVTGLKGTPDLEWPQEYFDGPPREPKAEVQARPQQPVRWSAPRPIARVTPTGRVTTRRQPRC